MEKKMRKAVISASVVALVAPLLLAGATSQAHAATASASCSTSDFEVIYSVNITDDTNTFVIGNLQLRYSPSCRVTWARIVTNLSFGSQATIQSNSNPNLFAKCTGTGPIGTGCNTATINDAGTTSFAAGVVNTDFRGDGVFGSTGSF
jgi:hypothetical protein